MKILGVTFYLVNNKRCYEVLAIISGEDQISTPEGGSFSCLGFRNAFPREELVGTDNSEPRYVGINADLITIPNLGCTRLDFFVIFGYCFWFKRHCWLLNWDLGCYR